MKLAEGLLFGLVWIALLILASDAVFNIYMVLVRRTLY